MKEHETGRPCGRYREEEKCIQFSVGKAERKRSLGRPWHR